MALPRLAAANQRLTAVRPLMVHLEALVGLYRQAALGGAGAGSAGAISSAQHAAARSAQALDLAMCVPVAGVSA